ncbi:MAG: AAA family ATPase [Clostridia bacterium]|nr:AAA family ATPase [Clostridia bacterium]
MGIYLNPNNDRFRQALNSAIYVDKSGLISVTNQRISTEQKYICVSRPRRFGKSVNLGMLAAYYSRGCESERLFDNLSIAKDKSYRIHLNHYNVIYLNMQQFLSNSHDIEEMLNKLKISLIYDLEDDFEEIRLRVEMGLTYNLNRIYLKTHTPFVVLIDEWDCVMREHKNDKESQKAYLDFLRDLLKDQDYVALAYMTGILPIKKYGTHSALNMFDEFSMLDSENLQRYIGFTDDEVRNLCEEYSADYVEMKAWYDGYKLEGEDLYCPRSVVRAIDAKKFLGFWTETETYEALAAYIAMNFDGLKDTVEKLLAGQEQPVDTRSFTNDMITFANADDILTLLIHLGYLGYHSNRKTVFIPNREIADEFVTCMKVTGLWKETIATVLASRQLLSDTLKGNADKVAEAIEAAHRRNSSILNYNNEQSLRFIILIAYYYARESYDIIQEMPSGDGFADIVFVPKSFVDATAFPPMVVELKWNGSTQSAIKQIKSKHYPDALASYKEVILVGINYDKDSKMHACAIEKYEMMP